MEVGLETLLLPLAGEAEALTVGLPMVEAGVVLGVDEGLDGGGGGGSDGEGVMMAALGAGGADDGGAEGGAGAAEGF